LQCYYFEKLGEYCYFLKLKYELKKASLSLTDTNAAQSVKVSTEPKKSIKPTNLLKEIIKNIGGGFF
jgi:hypothetical protein